MSKLEILDVPDVIGECVDDSGVDAVLEAEGFGEDEGVVVWVDGDGGGLFGIEFDDHFDWGFSAGGFGGGFDGGLIAEFGVEYFLDDAVGVGLEHGLQSKFKEIMLWFEFDLSG